MKTLVIISFTILLLIGCATSPKEQYDEYGNAIHLGDRYIQINKEFKYVGNLSTSFKKESIDGQLNTPANIMFDEHFFMHLNARNKIDKGLIVYSYKIKDHRTYWREEMNFSDAKNYQSRMHIGHLEINNIKCPCVVKKWTSVGERYVKFAKEKGYEFDMSKNCLIEAKIGKNISRSQLIAVSYLEGIDKCENVRNIEGENPDVVSEMLDKLNSYVNIR